MQILQPHLACTSSGPRSPQASQSYGSRLCEWSLPIHINIPISTSSPDCLHLLAVSKLLFAASRIYTLHLVGLHADILHVLDHLHSLCPLEALNPSVYDSGPPSKDYSDNNQSLKPMITLACAML